MNKVGASPEQAIADIKDGATIAIAGFSVNHGFATNLLVALRDKGTKDLTLVCNSLGDPHATRGQILAENDQVKKLVAAFYSPTGADTALAQGKKIREFDGKPHVLEPAIRVDFAFRRGYRADRLGNVQFRGGNQNFNPSFAKSAKCAIVEVDEIVEPGVIPPELIDLPGIFVQRVMKTTQPKEGKLWKRPERRPSDKPRLYNEKPALTRQGIAKNAARLVKDGTYVNLGVGIPTMVSNYFQGRDV